MEVILIILAIIIFLVMFAFFWCMWIVVKRALPDDEDLLFLHCFQCEIEMPVKEKNGKLYCKNCGLLHTNDYV